MRKLEYQYDDGDLLKNPQKYQKTEFKGNEFLIAYKKSRQQCIDKIENKKYKKNSYQNMGNKEIELILHGKKIHLEKLLNELLNLKTNDNEKNSKNNIIIDTLLKKFEDEDDKLLLRYLLENELIAVNEICIKKGVEFLKFCMQREDHTSHTMTFVASLPFTE